MRLPFHVIADALCHFNGLPRLSYVMAVPLMFVNWSIQFVFPYVLLSVVCTVPNVPVVYAYVFFADMLPLVVYSYTYVLFA